ncbi:AfsR/SARP family transcriptional regulator [Sciscionella marina]|uniref:AfsR/SARP family transcriptional regulator n=1 Tax=Sciscionella marina TaxID=508770 RepID=UPI00035F4C0D|nr:BTAD domain-containing putative transcriptional regulator [Sciscionella marina]
MLAADHPRYRLLGPVGADGPGGPIRLGGPKQRAVLAALLLRANQVVPETQLFDLVWGEQPPPSIRGRLQVYISELRKRLGREVIDREPAGYRITVHPGELDLHRFDRLVEQAKVRQTAGEYAAAAACLRQALTLWDGEALGGTTETLTGAELPALEQRRLVTLEECFEAELAAGEHAAILGELRTATGRYPFRERLCGLLMRALQRSGQATAALAVYRETRNRLRSELGIEPGAELRAIQAGVLGGEPEKPVTMPIRPIRPAELPARVRGFTGRAEQLAALNAQLAEDGTGLWVLSGTGGIGKTTLAVHWAHSMRACFPDGQLYLDLRGYDADHEPLTPAVALAHLLRGLGIDPRAVPTSLDDQLRLYRSTIADRAMLVLLDNARDTAQVLPLLPPSGTTVVTSRNRLGELVARAGARTIALGPLSGVESRGLLSGVLGAEVVAGEPDAARELARLCDGLPLAMRIAAAKVLAQPRGTLRDVAAELSTTDPIGGLVLDGAEESPVATTFALSYLALEPLSRRLFRLLGLIPGNDFTADAAAALAGIAVAEANRLLDRLAAAHLLECHSRGRYHMHDLVRSYAACRAHTEEDEIGRARARERLGRFYLTTAEAAWPVERAGAVRLPVGTPRASEHALSFVDSTAALAWLSTELGNLIAVATTGPHEIAWNLAEVISGYVSTNGHQAQWLAAAPVILDRAQRSGAHSVAAFLRLRFGEAYFRSGDHEHGIHHLREAVAAGRAQRWRECEAAAQINLGNALEWTGRLTEAVEHTLAAVELNREVGNPAGHSAALSSLGSLYHNLGRLHEAERSHRAGLEIAAGHRLVFWEAANHNELGLALHALGESGRAIEHIRLAGELLAGLGAKFGGVHVLLTLSRIHTETGVFEPARAEAERAWELAAAEDDKLIHATALIALGRAETGLGRLTVAERRLRQACRVSDAAGFGYLGASARLWLAETALAATESGTAAELAGQAADWAGEHGYRVLGADADGTLAAALAMLGEPGPAATARDRATTFWQESGHVPGSHRLQRLLAA